MAFRTKLDFSNNRQVKQFEKSQTILSGGTSFGLTFSALTSGPDPLTSGDTSSITFVASTFSGNSATTVYNWFDPAMSLGEPYLSALTPSISAITQVVGSVFGPNTTTVIDGNTVNLSYSGVGFDILPIAMYNLGGGAYSGTVETADLIYYSATSLDYTGRTIWADISGITRTENLIVTNNPIIGNVWGCIDSEGKGGWIPVSAACTTNIWISGTGLNSAILNGGGGFASGTYSVAEGYATYAEGYATHAEGYGTSASTSSSSYSHVEGYQTIATNNAAHAEGYQTIASGSYSHAEGKGSTASGRASHAEGGADVGSEIGPIALGDYSHAEGNSTLASGNTSHAEGYSCQAIGDYSHAEGLYSIAHGYSSHSQGGGSQAYGNYSHAQGSSQAFGNYSHSEGSSTKASGDTSHAGGSGSTASGTTSFVHGINSVAVGNSTIVLGSNITGSTSNTTYVERLNIKSLGVYADNAAATSAGLEVGTVYRTSTGDLKIRY